jgi:uncharacterized protein (TIGR03546 family)
MPIWPKRIRDPFRALWLSHSSPRRLAFALALGVFLGASPLWGLHTLLAIAFALLLGLNKPAVLLGTLVSNPVFAPLLIFLSLEAGTGLLYGRTAHLSLEEIKTLLETPNARELLNEYVLPYCVGSVLVGGVFAFLTFWIALWMARTYRARGIRPCDRSRGNSPGAP